MGWNIWNFVSVFTLLSSLMKKSKKNNGVNLVFRLGIWVYMYTFVFTWPVVLHQQPVFSIKVHTCIEMCEPWNNFCLLWPRKCLLKSFVQTIKIIQYYYLKCSIYICNICAAVCRLLLMLLLERTTTSTYILRFPFLIKVALVILCGVFVGISEPVLFLIYLCTHKV